MASNLEGSKIVIVGGSSGIGFGVAKAALLDRASEIIIASSSKNKVDGAVDRLREFVKGHAAGLKGTVSGEALDVTKSEDIKAFFTKVGEIDHLVWTSGGGISSSRTTTFKDINFDSPETADNLNIKFWGAAIAAQVAKFRGGSAASFTMTTGTAMVRPPPNWSILVGCLGAVDALGRGLAVDLAPVRVNIISPGVIKTELWDTSGFPKDAQAAIMNNTANKLLVKHVADADEIAEAYIFVMKCKYVTGQTIQVDGGATLV